MQRLAAPHHRAHQTLEHQHRAVGAGRQRRRVGPSAHHAVLGLDDHLVLGEGLVRDLDHRVRLRVGALAGVGTPGEEVARAVRGHRRHRLGGEAAGDGLLQRRHALARRRARARRVDAAEHQQHARHEEIVAGVEIQLFGRPVVAHRDVGGARAHPAVDAHAARQARHARAFHREGRPDAEAVAMHIGEVREIEQVVVDQLVRRGVVEMPVAQAPALVVETGGRRDQRGIRLCRIADPHPDPAVARLHRIAAHARQLRDRALAGYLDAAPRGRELEAVVHAAQVIAFATPQRQRREAVAAAVLERHQSAVLAAVDDDRLVGDADRVQAIPLEVVVPAGDIPAVVRVHASPLSGTPRLAFRDRQKLAHQWPRKEASRGSCGR